jgi:hypothetical protein
MHHWFNDEVATSPSEQPQQRASCSPAYHRLTTEVMTVQRKRNTVSVKKGIMIETRRAH